MDECTYGHLIFLKGAKIILWEKDSIFKIWWLFNWRSVCRGRQIDSFLSSCTKPKSKWIKDLHIKPHTLNLIEEKEGKTLEHIDTEANFMNRTSLTSVLRSPIDKWDLIKLQSFCKADDPVNRTKQQPTELEKIITNPTCDNGLISNTYNNWRNLQRS